MAGCRSVICGSKVGRNRAAPFKNMLGNCGATQGVWGWRGKVGVSGRKEKGLGHLCERRAGAGREGRHQQSGSGRPDPILPSGLALRSDSHDNRS